jgi:hypothetical protein
VDFGFLGSGYFYRSLISLRENGRIVKENTFLHRVLNIRTLVAQLIFLIYSYVAIQ